MNTFSETPIKPDILIHSCCGPCLEWPARQLMEEGYHLLAWYFNPNIQPEAENRRRRESFQKLAELLQIPWMAKNDCEPENWLNWNQSGETRCRMCYRRRLTAAALQAKALGIPAFTTTLLVSPWQDHEALHEIGEAAGLLAGVKFFYRDFRSGYRQGQALAQGDGLYRQRYCGCLPSLDQSDFKEKILKELAGLPD